MDGAERRGAAEMEVAEVGEALDTRDVRYRAPLDPEILEVRHPACCIKECLRYSSCEPESPDLTESG